MVLINGYDETIHRGPFRLYRIHWIADGGLGFDPLISVIKRIRSLSLNHDLTVKMRPPRVSSRPLKLPQLRHVCDSDAVDRESTKSMRDDCSIN